MNQKQLNNLKKAQDYAKSRGGECLSEEYSNNKQKMLWKCSNPEHPQWYATYDNCLNKNTWCIHCSGKLPKEASQGLKEAQTYAKNKGGECLSTIYESRQKNLQWKCSHPDHPSWFAPTDTVIHKNTWCKLCGFEHQKELKKDTQGLQKCKDYAKSKGGYLISTEYVNQNTNVEWKCANKNHPIFSALPKIVTRGTWCIQCSREKKKLNSS